jgi:hypothetical protein
MPALSLLSTAKPGLGAVLAAGNFDFITSASGTAVSSLSVENCFSADYSTYLVMRNLLGSGAGVGLHIRLRASGTDASGTDYRYQYINASSTTVSGARATGGTYFQSPLGYTETTACGFGAAWISNPFEAVQTTCFDVTSVDATANIQLETAVQSHDLTTSYTGLTVLVNTGTFTGSIFVWGVKS